MAKKLPQAFVEKMSNLLADEFEAFMASYDESRYYGLRVNTLKISTSEFESVSPFSLKPVPWAAEGYYYGWGDRPGKHPYYHAGLYYIQEPSAMSPAELLQVKPGDRVLDLCAAPGGKSTQIAAKLQGRGLLVSNDNQAERIKALVKNLAVFGVRNAVVTNETPDKLERAFSGFFDKIVIDAPCSGEGMFRKDEAMVNSWESHSVEKCAIMQKDILDSAARLLAPGGRIVYSTCTFSPEENEATIARFLDTHPDFAVVRDAGFGGFRPGRPEWINGRIYSTGETFSPEAAAAVAGTFRLWPHLIEGEGHYVAVLQHDGGNSSAKEEKEAQSVRQEPGSPRGKKGSPPSSARMEKTNDLGIWFDFMKQNLASPLDGRWVTYGDRVYWTDWELPDLDGISVARPGWFVGTLKKNRFEPSQALAMGLRMQDAARTIHFKSDDPDTIRYLKGETLTLPEDRIEKANAGTPSKGYCLIGVDGFPLGWGKWQDGMLKNEYPPGWRWT